MMNVEQVAKTCHEVNRTYCKSIGDDSQPKWSDAPEWQKSSAINGVRFHIKNPNAGPSSSHISWMDEKVNDGWKYGAVKDPSKKEHPCIVDYEDLPDNQKTKDYLFISVVKSFE